MNVVDRVAEAAVIPTELRAKWNAFGMVPLWEAAEGPAELPSHWRWADLHPIMAETASLTLPTIAERRVMLLTSPTNPIQGSSAACGMLHATMQVISPGETARPHRHSMNALRFILDGQSAETLVNGQPCRMQTGDLITTPAWTWHEHRHPGNAPVFWLDVLDVNLHWALGTSAFEPGPAHDFDPPIDASVFGQAKYMPTLMQEPSSRYAPTFHYPLAEALAAVGKAPTVPDGSRRIRYANPLTGGPVIDTIDCYLLELEEGQSTTAFKSSASAVCSVIDGSGETQCGESSFCWSPKDVFTVPANTWVSHRATSKTAHIFIATDREVYRRLDLLTEQTRP